jgi:hypothetical protein
MKSRTLSGSTYVVRQVEGPTKYMFFFLVKINFNKINVILVGNNSSLVRYFFTVKKSSLFLYKILKQA